jgi:hypothetical protein
LEQQNGVWLPKSSKLYIYDSEKGQQIEGTYDFELESFSSDLPADVNFHLKFPVGMAVWDDLSKSLFYAGKVVQITDSTSGITHFESIESFPDLKAMTDYSTGLSDAEWKSTPIGQMRVESPLDSEVSNQLHNLIPSVPVNRSHTSGRSRWIFALIGIILCSGVAVWAVRNYHRVKS